MNFGPDDVAEVERIIASAIAPAFLLNGLFALLNVLTGRLGRLIDRERAIREGRATPLPGEGVRLAQRARATHRGIVASAISATLLAALIVWSFIGGLLGLPVAWVLAALLTSAMLALILALVYFLSEVRIAAKHLPLDHDGHG